MLTKEYIEKFFLTEKHDGIVMIIAGMIALALAIFFFVKGEQGMLKGVSIVLAITGAMQIAMGYPGFMHSDNHRVEMIYAFDMNPTQLKNEELPRMEKSIKSIRTYRIIELTAFFCGLVLVAIFITKPDRAIWFGVGLGLALQAFVIFFMDQAYAKRAEQYWFYLKTFVAR